MFLTCVTSKVVELNVGELELRTARRAKVRGNLPHIFASWGRLLYTPIASVERVVG